MAGGVNDRGVIGRSSDKTVVDGQIGPVDQIVSVAQQNDRLKQLGVPIVRGWACKRGHAPVWTEVVPENRTGV